MESLRRDISNPDVSSDTESAGDASDGGGEIIWTSSASSLESWSFCSSLLAPPLRTIGG